jgi:hypothetical protein
MSLEQDITMIKSLVEAQPVFKPATPENLTNRIEYQRKEEERLKAERAEKLGPLFKKLADKVVLTRKWLNIYEQTLERFRHHSDRSVEYHAGNYPTTVSYRIKVHAWPSDEFVRRMEEEHDIDREEIYNYMYEEFRRELEGFVGIEQRYDPQTKKEVNQLTGGGLAADYPNLIEDFHQSGRSGGWLTLELTDLGFEDFDSIEYDVNNGEYAKTPTYSSGSGTESIEGDIEFVDGFRADLKNRIDALHEIDMKVHKGVKAIEKYIESTQFEEDFKTAYDIAESIGIVEQEGFVFKPATPDQQATRLFPNNPKYKEKYLKALVNKEDQNKLWKLRQQAKYEADRPRREAETARVRAFYASLPYTYEDIIKLPAYEKIMDLQGVKDVTGPIMKEHKSTTFRITVGEFFNEYTVHANGTIRTSVHENPSVLKRNPPAMTLEAYNALLNRLYDTMYKFYAYRGGSALYRYGVYLNDPFRQVDTVYYRRKKDRDYVRRSLIDDGYNPDIFVIFTGIKKGELVRENR